MVSWWNRKTFSPIHSSYDALQYIIFLDGWSLTGNIISFDTILSLRQAHCAFPFLTFWTKFTLRSLIAGRESGYSTIMVNNSLILRRKQEKTTHFFYFVHFLFKTSTYNNCFKKGLQIVLKFLFDHFRN